MVNCKKENLKFSCNLTSLGGGGENKETLYSKVLGEQ
jgi:hypothetical protein